MAQRARSTPRQSRRPNSGTWVPNTRLMPMDGARVYTVMRAAKRRYWTVPDVVRLVRAYEKSKRVYPIGGPRSRAALHWLVKEGYVLSLKRRPFQRNVRHLKEYVIADQELTKLPDEVPRHVGRNYKKRRPSA